MQHGSYLILKNIFSQYLLQPGHIHPQRLRDMKCFLSICNLRVSILPWESMTANRIQLTNVRVRSGVPTVLESPRNSL